MDGRRPASVYHTGSEKTGPGIVEGAKEDKAGWSAFLSHLKERGLRGVELIVSDACIGLVKSAAEFFPEARRQRCMVHFAATSSATCRPASCARSPCC